MCYMCTRTQVLLNAASVCIVSLAALNGSSNEGQVLKGIGFIGGGCFVMACQLVLEEVSTWDINLFFLNRAPIDFYRKCFESK